MREKDKYVQTTFDSNMDETYLTSWKTGETLIGASGRLTSRVPTSGNDHLGRCSWMDIRRKRGRLIRAISAYRVSKDSPAHAGETTSYKQQARSLMLHGVNKHNPKKRFLQDLTSMINAWRDNKVNRDVILMADMNEFIGDRKDLHDFCQHNDFINGVFLLDPDKHEDHTYLWGTKHIDYILVSPALAELAIKAGHH